eukprot:12128680-Alexandrium_andersonii.AAC.1
MGRAPPRSSTTPAAREPSFGPDMDSAGTRLQLRLLKSPAAPAAEARAASLAIELLLQAAVPGPRVAMAGDCRT